MSEMEKALNYSQKVCLRCGANDYTSVLVSWRLPYKVPQTRQLKARDIYPLSLRGQKSELKLSEAMLLLRALGRIPP